MQCCGNPVPESQATWLSVCMCVMANTRRIVIKIALIQAIRY